MRKKQRLYGQEDDFVGKTYFMGKAPFLGLCAYSKFRLINYIKEGALQNRLPWRLPLVFSGGAGTIGERLIFRAPRPTPDLLCHLLSSFPSDR